jgi:hypothetical protein
MRHRLKLTCFSVLCNQWHMFKNGIACESCYKGYLQYLQYFFYSTYYKTNYLCSLLTSYFEEREGIKGTVAWDWLAWLIVFANKLWYFYIGLRCYLDHSFANSRAEHLFHCLLNRVLSVDLYVDQQFATDHQRTTFNVVHNDIEVGTINYKGVWKGGPGGGLGNRDFFWALKWQQAKRMPFCTKKV